MIRIRHKWFYHLLILLIFLFTYFFGDYVRNGKLEIIQDFHLHDLLLTLSIFTSLLIIYILNFWVLCPSTLEKKKVSQFLIGLFLLLFLFAGIRYLLDEIVIFHIVDNHNYGETKRVISFYVYDNTYYSTRAVLSSTALYLFFLFIENKEKVLKLQLENKKAELSIVKSQISPHFLFNTLNSFYVELLEKQPKTAKDIHRLSALLRFVTYEAQQDFIPLTNDITFIKDYIYFYKKRFENNLYLDFHIDGTVLNQKIPTMMLIHFVENVFKHGLTNDPLNPAKINISITEEFIELSTSNKVATSESYEVRGIGYQSIKKRLDVLFDGRYILNYQIKNHYFNSYLKILVSN